MTLKIVRNRKINLQKTGINLFCLYTAASFFANDVLLPRAVSSCALYLFLAYSVLFLFIKRTLRVYDISVWMLGVMAFSLVSMLYSPEKNLFSGTYYMLFVNLVIVLLLSQYDPGEEAAGIIGWTYIVSSSFMMIALAATGNITDSSASGRLGESLVGNANAFAAQLMASAIYAIWFLVYSKKNLRRRLFILSCVALDYFGMFLSGGRKYIVVPLLFLYVLLLFKQDSRNRRHFIKYTFMMIAIALLIYQLVMKVPAFYKPLGVRIEGMLSFINGDTARADASSVLRDKMIRGGLKGWLASPVWGNGFDSFKYYNISITGLSVYSHNNYVEMLFNTGIIGFALYYWYYLYTCGKAWKARAAVPVHARAFSTAVIAAMLFYEYGAINYTSTSTMVLLCLANAMLRAGTGREGGRGSQGESEFRE